jgi:hypothetical protein
VPRQRRRQTTPSSRSRLRSSGPAPHKSTRRPKGLRRNIISRRDRHWRDRRRPDRRRPDRRHPDRRHRAGRGPPRRQRIGETIASTLRLTGLTLLLNLLALPVYLLVPGINLFLFLLGREYFEVVALRRLDAAATRAARNRFGLRVFLGGVMIAALFSLPLVNLVAPVIATAFMVHVFEALPRIESHSPGPHPLTRSVV